VSGERPMRNLLVTFMVIFLLFSPQSAEAGILKAVLNEVLDFIADNPKTILYWGLKAKSNELKNKRAQEKEKKRKESALSRDMQMTREKLGGRRTEKSMMDRGQIVRRRQRQVLQPGLVVGNKKEKAKETISQSENRDKHLLFSNQRSAREAIKCKDGNPKMVIGYGATVYAEPDLASSVLGKYEPNERICVEEQVLEWRKTPFGWLEYKNIF
jgi:hypothetical protein